jgi:hypothetical protein
MKGARSEEQDLLVGSSIAPSTVLRNGGGVLRTPDTKATIGSGRLRPGRWSRGRRQARG